MKRINENGARDDAPPGTSKSTGLALAVLAVRRLGLGMRLGFSYIVDLKERKMLKKKCTHRCLMREICGS
jgi:hypothetical protein